MSTGVEIAGGIYRALSGNTDVTDITARIRHLRALQSDTKPYIIIGERTKQENVSTKDAVIEQWIVRIRSYVVDDRTAIENLRHSVYTALHRQELTLLTHGFVDCVNNGLNEIFMSGDGRFHRGVNGRVYQAVQDFKVTVQEV